MADVLQRLLIVILAVSFVAGQAWAGKLDKFEKDATKDRSDRRRDDPSPDHWDDDDRHYLSRDGHADNPLDRFCSGMFHTLLISPVQASWARADDETHKLSQWGMTPREPGDPMLPILRVDGAYHDIESDVEALDYRLQLGYGPLAFELNGTRFEEDNPSDTLDLYRLYGLFRLSYSDAVEIDLGIGGIILDGDETNTGFSATIPFLIRATDWLLVEFRPMWSEINDTRIDEYEIGVLVNWEFAALKAGYRWLESPNESLNGPFVGLSVRY